MSSPPPCALLPSKLDNRLNEGDGIVLQFPAATQSNNLKMRKREVDESNKSLVQLHSTSTVKMFPSSVSLVQETSPAFVEWREAKPLQRQATQSLSAVKRKQPHGCGDALIGGDVAAVDEVLCALNVENKSLTALHTQSQPDLVAGGGVARERETSSREVEDGHCLRKSFSLELSKIETQTTVSSLDNPPPKVKGSLLPSLPFKPVLVNRYKQVVSPKPSVSSKIKEFAPEVSSVIEGSTNREGEQPSDEYSNGAANETLIDRSAVDLRGMEIVRQASGEVRSQDISSRPFISQGSSQVKGRAVASPRGTSQVSSQPGGGVVTGKSFTGQTSGEVREGEVARQSLTEHTVKIITDKVRQMDARYV